MMKFESQNDIPAFNGKSARERAALRRLPMKRDRSIPWHELAISGLACGLGVGGSGWILSRFTATPDFALKALVAGLSAGALTWVFNGIFVVSRRIVSRMRKAWESEATGVTKP